LEALRGFAGELDIEGAETKNVEELMELLRNAKITATDNTIKVKIGEGSDVEPKTLGNAEKPNSAILRACGDDAEIKSLLDSGDAKTRALIYTAFMKFDPEELQKAAGGDPNDQRILIQNLNIAKKSYDLFGLIKKFSNAGKRDGIANQIKDILTKLSPEDLKKVLQEQNNCKFTLLTSAASRDDPKALQAIIDAFGENKTALKETLMQQDGNGDTSLTAAMAFKKVEVFEAVIDAFKDNKADLKEILWRQDGRGETASAAKPRDRSKKEKKTLAAEPGAECAGLGR
jgi:hypothetical protein